MPLLSPVLRQCGASHGGTPIAGWFIVGNPVKIDDSWGIIIGDIIVVH